MKCLQRTTDISTLIHQEIPKGLPVNFSWGHTQCIPEAGKSLAKGCTGHFHNKKVTLWWSISGHWSQEELHYQSKQLGRDNWCSWKGYRAQPCTQQLCSALLSNLSAVFVQGTLMYLGLVSCFCPRYSHVSRICQLFLSKVLSCI